MVCNAIINRIHTIWLRFLVAIASIDVICGSIMTTSSFEVKSSCLAEGLPSLRPLFGHFIKVCSSLVTFNGFINFGRPTSQMKQRYIITEEQICVSRLTLQREIRKNSFPNSISFQPQQLAARLSVRCLPYRINAKAIEKTMKYLTFSARLKVQVANIDSSTIYDVSLQK